MRVRTAIILAAVVVAAMFVLDYTTRFAVQRWAAELANLTPAQLIRVRVAFLWSRYWTLGAPLILAIFVLIARLVPPQTAKT
jgi:hypothetical protein